MIWVAIAGGLLAAVACAELGARHLLRRRNAWFVRARHTRIRMQVDLEALPRLEPLAWNRTNADGERGDPLPTSAYDPGLYRILVAGGSAGECWYLDQHTAWSGRLQTVLREERAKRKLEATHVHVGSVARSGSRAETVEWILRKVLPRYAKLDCLVLMVGGSDMIRWLQLGAPTEFPKDDDPVDDVFENHPLRHTGWRFRRWALRRVLADFNRRFRRPLIERTRAGKKYTRLRRLRREAERMIDVTPDPAPLERHFRLHLRRVIETARNIMGPELRIVLVRQPWIDRPLSESENEMIWNFALGEPHRHDTSVYYSVRVAQELMQHIDRCASEVARELGVEQVNPRPIMDGGEEDYHDLFHYTSAGSVKLAELLASHILEGRRHQGPESFSPSETLDLPAAVS